MGEGGVGVREGMRAPTKRKGRKRGREYGDGE